MNGDQNNISIHLDYVMTNLLDFFRDPKNEHRFLEAAKIALNHIARHKHETTRYKKRFMFFAYKLKNNITPITLRNFTKECFDSLKSSDSLTKIVPIDTMPSLKTLRKKAERDLSFFISSGHSETSAIARVANDFLKTKRQFDKKERLIRMAKEHPLKDNFSLLEINKTKLAKEDIRNHFLELNKNKNSMLLGLLKKAQSFSHHHLHKLLGDELFFLCCPKGFLDQQASTILIEVPTSAHLHALTYRKLEILRALKRDNAFRNVKNLRFKVASPISYH